MPVVKSHQKLLYGDIVPDPVKEANNFNDIDFVISSITDNILRDSPELLIETVNGLSDKRLLETAIIKDIESHRYRYEIFRDDLTRRVLDFMLGYGKLQQYIEDEDITDIDGTRFNQFLIKRCGIRSKIPVSFGSLKVFETYCRLIVIKNRGRLNENDSYYGVTDPKHRLRIRIMIDPESITGPAFSIRKHRMESYRLEDLKELGMLDDELADMLRKLASEASSIIFCGKSAAGKTTLLRAFVNILPEMERILILEPDTEIYPDKPYCMVQSTKKQNDIGIPADTYCYGEITGNEAWKFVKMASSGCRSIATMCSESAENAMTRLLILSRDSKNCACEKTVKEMLSRSVNIIFYLKDFKVIEVLEVAGYDKARDAFEYRRLYPCTGRENNTLSKY